MSDRPAEGDGGNRAREVPGWARSRPLAALARVGVSSGAAAAVVVVVVMVVAAAVGTVRVAGARGVLAQASPLRFLTALLDGAGARCGNWTGLARPIV